MYILDVFHHKSKGIFTLLNDECTLKRPSIENFANRLKNAWKRDESTPVLWDQKSRENMFLIRHFTNNVTYSMVCSMPIYLSEIFDEETKPKHTAKTVASSLKFEIDALTEQLRKTVSYK